MVVKKDNSKILETESNKIKSVKRASKSSSLFAIFLQNQSK